MNSYTFELFVRGEIPSAINGSLIVATGRRLKNRATFRRWHDSQAELLKLDIRSGRPGRVQATFLEIDPTGNDVGFQWPDYDCGDKYFRYVTQPNHGINARNGRVWATNLLFGSPLEVDLDSFRATRLIGIARPSPENPQTSSTSHFAWSLDGRYAYFHESNLVQQPNHCAIASDLSLVQLDTITGEQQSWSLEPPPDDVDKTSHNFHSAFFFEDNGQSFVGLLRTGAVLESVDPHFSSGDHNVCRMPFSTIWIIPIEKNRQTLHAHLLPGLESLRGIALSHLEIDNSSRNGFVLFANYKQADVGEESHGENVYGEKPNDVMEHYSGSIAEPLNYGCVLRYEQHSGTYQMESFSRPYDCNNTSQGHSWFPINLQLDSTGKHLYGSFAGFRPRLLSKHISRAYPDLAADYSTIRYVPPAIIRFDAKTLTPDISRNRGHISYDESPAMAIIPSGKGEDYVSTFSPEAGLRIYRGDNLSKMVCHAASAQLLTWKDTHFRPAPAHMVYLDRRYEFDTN